MISRILYRETVHSVLNYVFGKEGSKILGYQNMCSELGVSPKFFTNVLHFQGQRHSTQNRYLHITLNLPHGERIDDATFYEVAREYMEQMGFGEQPYCVVRHNDTKHEHVHIVSTVVTESGTLINLFNSYRRNVATQHYLEKRFGLSPSPRTKQQKYLPIYRLPEVQFRADETHGTKFYLQDVLNGLLQKYRLRSFKELKLLAKPYHITLRTMTNENGRVGVAYGIDNQKQYRTQFINGYAVHPKLSGPKLMAVFERNAKSKLLPMHKKRLEKQLLTTFNLFKYIRSEDLPDVLKSYQNIDVTLQYNRNKKLTDLIIYDKSGYVFNDSAISQQIDFTNHPKLMDNGAGTTCIDDKGKQFNIEVKKLIIKGFYNSYLETVKNNMLLSEWVLTQNLKALLPAITLSESYAFLHHYADKKSLPNAILNEYETTKKEFFEAETKKESKTLEAKAGLLQQVIDKSIFKTIDDESNTFHLLRSLGLKYDDGKISFINSNVYSVPVFLEKFKLPRTKDAFLSTGVIYQNQKVLETLVGMDEGKDKDLSATSFFLPLMLPELYEAMRPDYREKFEAQSLKAYLKASERSHLLFEKSPVDYIRLYNGKGFYFEKGADGIRIKSVYSKHPVSVKLARKTQAYLKSSKHLDTLLAAQSNALVKISQEGKDHLKNLWVSYLVEKELYDKAAFMMIYDGIGPNFDQKVIEYHMENGLRQRILEISKQKMNSQQAYLLRKSVYAFSAILGSTAIQDEEVFNGFKDELTDYSKRRSLFM